MMKKNHNEGLKCDLILKQHTGIGSAKIKGFMSCYGSSSGTGGIMGIKR